MVFVRFAFFRVFLLNWKRKWNKVEFKWILMYLCIKCAEFGCLKRFNERKWLKWIETHRLVKRFTSVNTIFSFAIQSKFSISDFLFSIYWHCCIICPHLSPIARAEVFVEDSSIKYNKFEWKKNNTFRWNWFLCFQFINCNAWTGIALAEQWKSHSKTNTHARTSHSIASHRLEAKPKHIPYHSIQLIGFDMFSICYAARSYFAAAICRWAHKYCSKIYSLLEHRSRLKFWNEICRENMRLSWWERKTNELTNKTLFKTR